MDIKSKNLIFITIKNSKINLKRRMYTMSNEKCGCKIEQIKKPVIKTEEKEDCGCNTEKKPKPKKNENCGCGCGK